VTSLAWHPTQREVMVTTADGFVALIAVPRSFPSTEHSFDVDLPLSLYRVALPPLTKKVMVRAEVPPSEPGEEKEAAEEPPLVETTVTVGGPRETGAALCAIYHPEQVWRGTRASEAWRRLCV
jgi:hypothetical protein